MLDGPAGGIAFRAYPARSPWLLILISHGFSEHLGWWDHVARAFQERGVSAYLFDHYHHGRSEGKKGDLPRYDLLTDGLKFVLEHEVMQNAALTSPWWCWDTAMEGWRL